MEQKLYDKGIEEAKTGYIIFENSLIISNVLVGFIGMYTIQFMKIPILSIIYFVFIATMLIFVLRKHLCTQCFYYDKSCHCGWGKLAAKLYGKETGNQKIGGLLAIITWMTLMFLPIIAIGILLFIKFSYLSLICLIVLIIIVTVNSILHVKDCKECKMKDICPGSAAKEK